MSGTGMRRSAGVVVAIMLALGALTACATASGAGDFGSSPSASPTATAACPQQPGVELPPECAPYDPDQAMAQNDLYRQRMDIDAQTRDAGDALVAPVTSALEALRASGDALTETDVVLALAAAGVEATPQTRSGAGDVLFGVAIGAGCLFGSVTPEAVSVDVGGYIMDGGCLPAQ